VGSDAHKLRAVLGGTVDQAIQDIAAARGGRGRRITPEYPPTRWAPATTACMFGFACDETPEVDAPCRSAWPTGWQEALAEVAPQRPLWPSLLPAYGKTQVKIAWWVSRTGKKIFPRGNPRGVWGAPPIDSLLISSLGHRRGIDGNQ